MDTEFATNRTLAVGDSRPCNHTYILCPTDALDLEKTFTCGQCFRWDAVSPGVYLGVTGAGAAVCQNRDGSVVLSGQGDEDFWRDYFDLDRDYAATHSDFLSRGGYLAKSAEYGAGIRILRQEPWEALCSFIISQCSNIPRIKKCVAALCAAFGETIDFLGQTLYTFPSAPALARLGEGDLAPLRLGYRAPYILAAARKVADGGLDLDALADLSHEEALSALMRLPGVGLKVASCAELYGLHISSGFPVDTWMRRALREHFPPDFDPKSLGGFAGLAQQYIFYYARSMG